MHVAIGGRRASRSEVLDRGALVPLDARSLSSSESRTAWADGACVEAGAIVLKEELPWKRNDRIHTVSGSAVCVWEIGEPSVGQRVVVVDVVSATSHTQRRAVLVDLARTDTVVPGPDKRQAAVGSALGQLEGEGVRVLVTIAVLWASAFEDLDEPEGGLGGRLEISGDGEVAGAAAVRGGTREVEELRFTDLHVVHGGDVVDAGAQLAGEVGARSAWSDVVEWGVVECVEPEWDRLREHQVRAGGRDERRSEDQKVEHVCGACCGAWMLRVIFKPVEDRWLVDGGQQL